MKHRKYGLSLLFIVLIILSVGMFWIVRMYEKTTLPLEEDNVVGTADVDTGVVPDEDDVVILEDSRDESVDVSDDTDTVDIDESNDTQVVSVGSVNFTLASHYESVELGDDALPIPGLELVEYDRESGLVVVGCMEKVSLPMDQYLYQISSNLIDTNEYAFQGRSEQKYGNVDWTMELYKSNDGSTGSLVACGKIENRFVCVFLHCLWTEYTETEFVEILSSVAAS